MSFLFPSIRNSNAPASQRRVIQRQTNTSTIRTMSQEDLGGGAMMYSALDIPNTARKSDRAYIAKQLRAKGMRVDEIAMYLDVSVSYTYQLLRS